MYNAPSKILAATMANPYAGPAYSAGAILIWGGFPVFFNQLAHIDSVVIIGHRMIWAMVFMLVVIAALGHLRAVREALTRPRTIMVLMLTGALLGVSWATYVWAVLNDFIIEASLGYYLSPLLSIVAAMVFFSERLSRLQWVSVLLAASGVASMIVINNVVPWIGIFLGAIFAVYSALRKKVELQPFVAGFIESLFLFPVGLGIVFLYPESRISELGLNDLFLLVSAGVVTILPLAWYICAARLMPLTTLATLFYLAPTLGFLSGVFLFDEPFTTGHAIMFGLILTGLGIFTVDAFRTGRGYGRPVLGTATTSTNTK